MYTVALWFFLFMYAINGTLAVVDGAIPGYNITSFTTNQTITPTDQQDINATFQNITSDSPDNSTSSGIIGFWDQANYLWNQSWYFLQLITGTFVYNVMFTLGMPTAVLAMVAGIHLFFVAVTAIHVIGNRFG